MGTIGFEGSGGHKHFTPTRCMWEGGEGFPFKLGSAYLAGDLSFNTQYYSGQAVDLLDISSSHRDVIKKISLL